MGVEHGAVLPGLDGPDEVGPRIGVASLAGVPVLEGSWLAVGVISVPVSLMDTDLTVDGRAVNGAELWMNDDEPC